VTSSLVGVLLPVVSSQKHHHFSPHGSGSGTAGDWTTATGQLIPNT
jgi:hypothetical protein